MSLWGVLMTRFYMQSHKSALHETPAFQRQEARKVFTISLAVGL